MHLLPDRPQMISCLPDSHHPDRHSGAALPSSQLLGVMGSESLWVRIKELNVVLKILKQISATSHIADSCSCNRAGPKGSSRLLPVIQ